MLNSLYLIFIQPIEYLLAFLYQVFYNITDSEIQTILLISITINILLIPVYNTFDYWQIQDRLKEYTMHPKLQMIKRSFAAQERFTMLKTLYRQFNYSPIYGIRNSFGFLLQIPFFIAAYQFLSHTPELANISAGILDNLSEPDRLIKVGDTQINALPIVMTVINLWSGFVYSKNLGLKDKIQIIAIALIFFILLYNSPSALVLYWTFNNVFSLLKNMYYMNKPADTKVELFIHSQTILPYLSIILFTSITFLYFPTKLISSDPTITNINHVSVLLSNFLSFSLIGIFLLFSLKYFLYTINKLLEIIVFIIAMFALLTTLHNFFDVGAFDEYLLPNIHLLGPIEIRIIVDIIIIIFSVAVYKYLSTFLLNLLVCLSIIATGILSTIYLSASLDTNIKNNQVLPSYIHGMASFSKNQPNIIVIMLDAFNNQHVQNIFQQDIKLASQFSGFTWYSNTLSAGNFTYLGEPGIHGGRFYTPHAINARSSQIDSIVDEIANGYTFFLTTIKENQFDITLGNVQFTNCIALQQQFNNAATICTDVEEELAFIPYYMQKHPIHLDKTQNDETAILNSIGLFNSFLYSTRNLIYNNGEWIFSNNMTNLSDASFKNYGFLEAFIDSSNLNAQLPTFKYIQSAYPHAPWQMDLSSCEVIDKPYNYIDRINGIHKDQYPSEYCSIKLIGNWLQWLKDNNIYDNTMIILVSDHERGGNPKLAQAFGADISKPNNKDLYPGHPASLLLIKDFNSTSPLQESTIFMSNSDVPSIICAQLANCTDFENDPRLHPDPQRKLIHSVGDWSINRHQKNKYNLYSEWEVTSDMYQQGNWKKIQ